MLSFDFFPNLEKRGRDKDRKRERREGRQRDRDRESRPSNQKDLVLVPPGLYNC